jgi:hypothetical protein
MGYFKINKTGCSEHKGLCEVRFDLYLSRTDEGNEEHYVTVPVFPEGGYSGEKNEIGIPIDMEAYNNWVASLPTETRNNPFCCHFCQFEPDVTDEEILFVGELALDMAMKNWPTRELAKNQNLPVNFSTDAEKKADCETRMETIHATDFVSFSETVKTKYSIRG